MGGKFAKKKKADGAEAAAGAAAAAAAGAGPEGAAKPTAVTWAVEGKKGKSRSL